MLDSIYHLALKVLPSHGLAQIFVCNVLLMVRIRCIFNFPFNTISGSLLLPILIMVNMVKF